MLYDLQSNVAPVSSLLPAVRTASANGSGVDLAGFQSAIAVFHFGAPGVALSGTVKIDYKIQDSDDNVTFADTTAVQYSVGTSAPVTLDANVKASQAYKVGYIGQKRYIRGVLTYTGTHTTGTPADCVIVGGNPNLAPV